MADNQVTDSTLDELYTLLDSLHLTPADLVREINRERRTKLAHLSELSEWDVKRLLHDYRNKEGK